MNFSQLAAPSNRYMYATLMHIDKPTMQSQCGRYVVAGHMVDCTQLVVQTLRDLLVENLVA